MEPMFDLHTHTFLSDGCLCPAELVRRAEVAGYTAFAMTDHVDLATVEAIVPRLVQAAERENQLGRMLVVPGAELTHVRPEHIAECVGAARAAGAQIVLCHGETIAEPVIPGTNRAAIEAGVDILAHPGLIAPEDARRAAANNVALEVTAKNGHCYTNGHVVRLARETGTRMVFGSDGHVPEHFRPRDKITEILRGAGLTEEEVERVFAETERILRVKESFHEAQGDPL